MTPVALSSQSARSPVNWRSVSLGLLGVILINLLTPFNNFVLVNTDLVGSFLPTGVLLFFLLLVVLINGPLSRWAPRWALGGGEMAVVLGMMLVGCALPAVGLMRHLPPSLTGIYHFASLRIEYARVLERMDLPSWLFPTTSASEIAQQGNDPVIRDYVGRAIPSDETLAARVAAVPWQAWVMPCISWGIFLAGLFGSILCLMVIFRRQWAENERLSFPLATVYLALIEPPAPGRWFNTLFCKRSFWIGFGAVLILHLVNGLAVYYPTYVPEIPLRYDLSQIFTEEPWLHMEWDFKSQRIFFIIIGLMMFMPSSTAFSLWFIFVLVQVVRMLMGMNQQVLTQEMGEDQTLGAVVVFGLLLLWVARHHLAVVLRQMFLRPREGDPRERYMPYALAGWGFVACQVLMIVWMCLAGSGVLGAILTITTLTLLYLVLAKVLADTGMIYALMPMPLVQPYHALAAIPGMPRAGTGSYFFACLFYSFFTADTRQSLPPYAQHAMVVADRAAYSDTVNWRKAIGFIAVLAFALGVAFLVSGASTLWVEYNYAATLNSQPESPINTLGAQRHVQGVIMDPTVRYASGNDLTPHNRWTHIGIGAAVTAALGSLRLRLASWPLHPVGFLLVYGWGLRQVWFSIFLGWVLKSLLIRYGGAKLFSQAQPLFIGLIMGEVLAAAFWLCVSFTLAMLGHDYHAISLLP